MRYEDMVRAAGTTGGTAAATVRAHFPDEEEVCVACRALWPCAPVLKVWRSIADARATSHQWIIGGGSNSEPYPCRCRERRGLECSPAWCPCAGRPDWSAMPLDCCARRFGPADHVRAMEAWRIWKLRQQALD